MSTPPDRPHQNPLWQVAGSDPPAPPGRTCGDCAWRYRPEQGPSIPRCHRHPDAASVRDDWPACPAWTGPLDCQACGACCGPGYDCVEVGRHERFARQHRDLLVEQFGQLQLPRPGGRCVCLEGQAPALSCRLYADRPQSCRDFPVAGRSCLEARRRVGLTA